MEPHNNSSSRTCSINRAVREEARRTHLMSLHRQVVPRRILEEITDDEISSTTSNMPRDYQMSEASYNRYPLLGERKNEGIVPLPNISFHNRSFSTATYQLPYNSSSNLPLYYIRQSPAIFPQTTQPPCPAEPPAVDHEADDDDVFVTSGARNNTGKLLMPTNQFPSTLHLQYNQDPFQFLLSRKRAHSAGDMVRLYSSSNIRFPYPYHRLSHSHKNVKNPHSTPFYLNGSASSYALPQKVLKRDNSASVVHNSTQHLLNMSTSIPTPTQNTAATSNISHLVQPNVSSSTEEELNKNKSSFSNQFQSSQVKNFNDIGQHPSSAKTPSTQQHTSTTKVSSSLKSTSLLKSSSKSSTKKKVVWNDLAKESPEKKDQASNTDKSHLSNNSLNIDVGIVKKYPEKFTQENVIGPYLIGPKLGSCPVKSISQYLVRKRDSNKYFLAKILQMQDEDEVKSGKMILHTEHSLLSLLDTQIGVIRQHGIFKDIAFNKKSGKFVPRVSLILDCLLPHEFSSDSSHYLNLQQYVIQMKRLSELEAIRIFYSIVTIVHSLHKRNVVHRDLKLGNMVIDKRTRRIILTNFCLGCHMTSDNQLLSDQRGSPAYISPDVLSDKPYAGKPSDMWSLGVILYTMLYGQFPFYDQQPKKLFAKIKAVEYTIPDTGRVSLHTNEIIRGLLTADPSKRLTAIDAIAALELRSPSWPSRIRSDFHVVPDVDSPTTLEAKSIVKAQPECNPSEDELTRAFYLKMLSDDEDENSATANKKTVRKYKRRIHGNEISRIASLMSPGDSFIAQELR